MATLRQKIEVEWKVRQWLAEYGMPEPDAIEYGFTCIRVFWYEPKLCVVVDIDSPPDDEDEAECG